MAKNFNGFHIVNNLISNPKIFNYVIESLDAVYKHTVEADNIKESFVTDISTTVYATLQKIGRQDTKFLTESAEKAYKALDRLTDFYLDNDIIITHLKRIKEYIEAIITQEMYRV